MSKPQLAYKDYCALRANQWCLRASLAELIELEKKLHEAKALSEAPADFQAKFDQVKKGLQTLIDVGEELIPMAAAFIEVEKAK